MDIISNLKKTDLHLGEARSLVPTDRFFVNEDQLFRNGITNLFSEAKVSGLMMEETNR